jgi:hypothetical protein
MRPKINLIGRKFGRLEVIKEGPKIKGTGATHFKHGLSKTRVYRAWANAKQRCYNRKNPQYRWYGGKGIHVDPSWASDFTKFFNDMGTPAKGRSLNRLDARGHYTAENCNWASSKQQAENQTRNVIFFRHKIWLVSKSGTITYKHVEAEEIMPEIGMAMVEPQTGICGCGKRCFCEEKWCGCAECNNDGNRAKWEPFVAPKGPPPINVWDDGK